MEMTQVKMVHFTIDIPSTVKLIREAWLYEDKEMWARKTLGYLAYGIGEDEKDKIFEGTHTLIPSKDGDSSTLAKDDGKWAAEVASHRSYLEDNYYTFANRKVKKTLVDDYTDKVVGRLRDAMRNPGIFAIADPMILINLESQRKELHDAIFIEAGFTLEDIENRSEAREKTDGFAEFSDALEDFVNNATGW